MKVKMRARQHSDIILPRVRFISAPEESAETVDQDELQLVDESDRDWVHAWSNDLKKDQERNKRKVRTLPTSQPF